MINNVDDRFISGYEFINENINNDDNALNSEITQLYG
jgi:hypothetical protein